jgi:hypothetical protein
MAGPGGRLAPSTPAACCGEGTDVDRSGGRLGTLLGPEGTAGRLCLGVALSAGGLVSLLVVGGPADRTGSDEPLSSPGAFGCWWWG